MSTNFIEALKASANLPAKDDSSQSVAGQLRLRLPDIEMALASGFTHRQILQQLNRDGIELTSAYYHRLIPKLRSEAKAAGAVPINSQVQGLVVQSDRPAPEPELEPVAGPPALDRTPAVVPVHSNSNNLSITIAVPAGLKPRTILGGKADGPKFKWDPKGAEKFDPNNL